MVPEVPLPYAPREEIKNLCENVLREVATRHHITIIELSVMTDHIRMVVALLPTMSISKDLHFLKGASSDEIFKRIPVFRNRYPRGESFGAKLFFEKTIL
jgi:REP element-mobilizing transposase RayT